MFVSDLTLTGERDMKIEHYQGDGRDGPFGYCQGVFIKWLINEEDEFDFILEEDHEWDIYESGDMADECDLEYALRKWIEEEGEKPNPVVLKRIQAACAEIGGEK
jgi:hypothetical protein